MEQYINKNGFITIGGVENIDPFLLALRFFGFDLWMNRYAETGKRHRLRDVLTKTLFYIALLLINVQMGIHIVTTVHSTLTKTKNFYNYLDDLRTLFLKLTMTFSVNFWFIK